jgi:hypothetical protein
LSFLKNDEEDESQDEVGSSSVRQKDKGMAMVVVELPGVACTPGRSLWPCPVNLTPSRPIGMINDSPRSRQKLRNKNLLQKLNNCRVKVTLN